jgi:hypothetical protein
MYNYFKINYTAYKIKEKTKVMVRLFLLITKEFMGRESQHTSTAG